MGLDALARDAVELQQLRLQLPGDDLLVVEGQRRHVGSFRSRTRASIAASAFPPGSKAVASLLVERKEEDVCHSRFLRCRTTTRRSSRISTSRRCTCTTTSTTRLTWTRQTQ